MYKSDLKLKFKHGFVHVSFMHQMKNPACHTNMDLLYGTDLLYGSVHDGYYKSWRCWILEMCM